MKKRTLFLECYSGVSAKGMEEALLNLGIDIKKWSERLRKMQINGTFVKDTEKLLKEAKLSAGAERFVKRTFFYLEGIKAVETAEELACILGIAFCLEMLEPEKILISPLYEGSGITEKEGIRIPSPEITEILKRSNLRLQLTEKKEEMLTPLGTALAAALADQTASKEEEAFTTEAVMPGGKLLRAGYGKGKLPAAGPMRALLFEQEQEADGQLWMLETNIDDSTGEALGYVTEKLLSAGALDVTCIPVYMKKNRPAVMLCVLTDETCRRTLEKLIFLHTTTIGIRRYPVLRSAKKRQIETMKTCFGKVRVKVIRGEDGIRKMPEYEDVRRICEETGRGFQEVYDQIKREAED